MNAVKEIKMDAKGKRPGRLASEIAKILMGKDSPSYAPNKVANVKVVVENAAEMEISEKKLKSETHERYSGYPGGRKVISWKKIVEKKGYGEILKKAVAGMLPKNKLQKPRMKNLTIFEHDK